MAASSDASRLICFDGLRGWAALSVAAFHFTWETFGARFPVFRNPMTAALFDGRLAVAVFFGISGYVLTYDGWGEPDKRQVRRRIIKRYPRLAIPVLACALLVFVLMLAGTTANQAAAAIVDRQDWLGSFLDFPPSLVNAVRFATFGTFVLDPGDSYGRFLWTMTYEFWGSVAVLLICWIERGPLVAYAALVVLAAICAVACPLALPIPLGALVAQAQRGGLFPKGPSRLLDAVGVVLIAACLGIAGATQIRDAVAGGNAAAPVADAGSVILTGPGWIALGGLAILILIGVVLSGRAQAFLSSRFSRFLGRFSFPVYLAQFPVLVTLTSFLIVETDAHGMLNLATAVLIALLSVAATFLLAWAIFMPVERLTAAAGKWLERTAERTAVGRPRVLVVKAPAQGLRVAQDFDRRRPPPHTVPDDCR